MGRFFPRSTNADYTGRLIAAYFLTLASVGTIVPGGIHAFLPDGGAGGCGVARRREHRRLASLLPRASRARQALNRTRHASLQLNPNH